MNFFHQILNRSDIIFAEAAKGEPTRHIVLTKLYRERTIYYLLTILYCVLAASFRSSHAIPIGVCMLSLALHADAKIKFLMATSPRPM